MDTLIEIPGDRTAANFAYAAAGLGVVGVGTLAAMYAIEVPRNGPYVFGTINDATGGVFSLVFKQLDFSVSTGISMGAMAVQAGWFLLAHRALLKTGGYPRRLTRLGKLIGGALLVGLAFAELAFAEQAPGWIRWGIGGAGFALGATAWAVWPYWYYLAGRHLSQTPSTAAVPGIFRKA